jgi:hypothetical protein
MTDYLRLTIEPDDDGTAELRAEVRANGFSGEGYAWFDLRYLADFALSLGNAFPLENVLELVGGYWAKDGTGLTQEHLGVRFYSVDNCGVVGCQIRLSTPVPEHGRPEEQHSVRVELRTHYQELQQFAGALRMLAQGKAHEAILGKIAA